MTKKLKEMNIELASNYADELKMLVYLFELDSVRNSKAEIIKGQQALFEEIVMNGNQVVLSFNQLTDSEAFLSILENEEVYEEMIGLFRCGTLRVSQFGRFRTACKMYGYRTSYEN